MNEEFSPRTETRCYQSRLERTRSYGARARATTGVARPRDDWAARSCARVAAAVCSSVGRNQNE
eukprot:6213890-Pleurochrysis_carterae.AAC.4